MLFFMIFSKEGERRGGVVHFCVSTMESSSDTDLFITKVVFCNVLKISYLVQLVSKYLFNLYSTFLVKNHSALLFLTVTCTLFKVLSFRGVDLEISNGVYSVSIAHIVTFSCLSTSYNTELHFPQFRFVSLCTSEILILHEYPAEGYFLLSWS